MAVQREKQYTVEEFDDFVNLPENAERLFEFIGGEIVEVPSNPYSSEIAATIIFMLRNRQFLACVLGSLPIGIIVGGYLWTFFPHQTSSDYRYSMERHDHKHHN